MPLLSLVLALSLASPDRIVTDIATLVENSYAVEETGARMAARLRERLASGAYAGLSASALAEKVDADLRSVANDQHMMVMYSETALPAGFGRDTSIIDPTADPAEAAYRNNGVIRVERLEGNVGLLVLDYFYPPQYSTETLAAAMNAVASTDALIIDVRSVMGGHPRTVAFLCSYFFEKRTHLNDIVDRQNRRTTSFWTEPVPGQRYLRKPVFVLTGNGTYSAAEEFAYNLKTLRRATIVGETTAGAANPSIPFRIDDHVMIYLPTGRAVNPMTKTNWEGGG